MTSQRAMQNLVLLLLISAFCSNWAYGQETPLLGACRTIDNASEKRIEAYLIKRYQLSDPSSLKLLESAQANNRCFWKLKYVVLNTSRTIIMYLSPDRHYLTPALMDLDLDPAIERQQEREHVQRQLAIGKPPSYGASETKVTLTEFSDFECPYCKRFSDLLEQAKGRSEMQALKVIFRQFPLSMHPWAREAAESEACLGLQSSDAFWTAAKDIFSRQRELSATMVESQFEDFAAKQPVIHLADYQACLQDGRGRRVVDEDLQLGQTVGVHGTPTVFINGTHVHTPQTVDELVQAVMDAIGHNAESSTSKVAPSNVLNTNPTTLMQCSPKAAN